MSRISPLFASATRAMAKSTAARMRSAGLLEVSADWRRRLEICRACPLYVYQGGREYCGKPFSPMTLRDAETEGCGCPIIAKARSPREECPRHRWPAGGVHPNSSPRKVLPR